MIFEFEWKEIDLKRSWKKTKSEIKISCIRIFFFNLQHYFIRISYQKTMYKWMSNGALIFPEHWSISFEWVIFIWIEDNRNKKGWLGTKSHPLINYKLIIIFKIFFNTFTEFSVWNFYVSNVFIYSLLIIDTFLPSLLFSLFSLSFSFLSNFYELKYKQNNSGT